MKHIQIQFHFSVDHFYTSHFLKCVKLNFKDSAEQCCIILDRIRRGNYPFPSAQEVLRVHSSLSPTNTFEYFVLRNLHRVKHNHMNHDVVV